MRNRDLPGQICGCLLWTNLLSFVLRKRQTSGTAETLCAFAR